LDSILSGFKIAANSNLTSKFHFAAEGEYHIACRVRESRTANGRRHRLFPQSPTKEILLDHEKLASQNQNFSKFLVKLPILKFNLIAFKFTKRIVKTGVLLVQGKKFTIKELFKLGSLLIYRGIHSKRIKRYEMKAYLVPDKESCTQGIEREREREITERA